ncbi:hypothetical protein FKW77_000986 [Venturia effusa]|uniref:Uncharacterized protein n=1 Tax=Venturia effusa TaxID=50376 RepID=A0A517LNC1_9PEZI|nr:hypothetical protein FKW77_000986 [Venturia effusa]
MGTLNLYRRLLGITTPPDFQVTHSEALHQIQARQVRLPGGSAQIEAGPDQIVKAAPQDKALVTATTTSTMTMMVHETPLPGMAGSVGTKVAAEPTAIGQQAVKQDPTGTLTAPPLTTSNMAPNPSSQTAKDGISTGTAHLLIAAGSIGATILVVLIVFLVYRVRSGKPLRDVFKGLGSRQSSHSLKPIDSFEKDTFVSAPLGNSWEGYSWEKNKGWDAETSFAASSSSLKQNQYFRSEPAFLGPVSNSSGRSQLAASPSRPPFPPPNLRSASSPLLRSNSVPPTIPLPPDPPAKARLASIVPSPSLLPRNRPRSQSASETSNSNGAYPAYLENMALHEDEDSAPKVSRFSWTNSQAPRTPVDARFSVASSVHSVTRYRTVESWVGQQTGKLEESKMQDNLRQQIELAIKEVKDATSSARAKKAAPNPSQSSPPSSYSLPVLEKEKQPCPPIPATADAPSKFRAIPEDGEMLDVDDAPPEVPRKSFDMIGSAAPRFVRGRTRQQRLRHVTAGSDAPIFQVHPGTKVRIPSESYIPSVILDDNVRGKLDGLKSRRESLER